MVHHVEVRRGVYRDSVTLMQLSVALEEDDGIEFALVAMATGFNLELAAEAGYELPADLRTSDLFVAVDAADTDAARVLIDRALAAVASQAGSNAKKSFKCDA